MKLTALKANELASTLKVTVQKTGKLGFTDFTARHFNLDTDTYVHFFMDEDEPKCPILTFSREASAEAFRVKKSGDYYSLSTTALFDKLRYDYKTETVLCELRREEAADALLSAECYRLIPRTRKTRKAAVMTL